MMLALHVLLWILVVLAAGVAVTMLVTLVRIIRDGGAK